MNGVVVLVFIVLVEHRFEFDSLSRILKTMDSFYSTNIFDYSIDNF